MKKLIMYIHLADNPDLPEEIDSLPKVQIIHEGEENRTVGIKEVTRAILDVVSFLEQHSEYIPFQVEIWSSNEPGSPPIRERRRRKMRREEGGV